MPSLNSECRDAPPSKAEPSLREGATGSGGPQTLGGPFCSAHWWKEPTVTVYCVLGTDLRPSGTLSLQFSDIGAYFTKELREVT